MKIIEPKIELTENEVDAINAVIALCNDLNSIDDNFLALIFDESDGDDIRRTIDTLTEILYTCKD